MTLQDEQKARLPKFAREYIARVERERDDAIGALKDFMDSQSPSCVYFDNITASEHTRNYLQTDRVMFSLDGDKNNVEVSLKNGRLTVYAHSGIIIVQPRSSNVVMVSTTAFGEEP